MVLSACPFVAGVAALYLNGHPTASQEDVKSSLICSATSNILFNQPPATNNLLLYANVQPCASSASSSSASSSSLLATEPSNIVSPTQSLQPPSSPPSEDKPAPSPVGPTDLDANADPTLTSGVADGSGAARVVDAKEASEVGSTAGKNGVSFEHDVRCSWIFLVIGAASCSH